MPGERHGTAQSDSDRQTPKLRQLPPATWTSDKGTLTDDHVARTSRIGLPPVLVYLVAATVSFAGLGFLWWALTGLSGGAAPRGEISN